MEIFRKDWGEEGMASKTNFLFMSAVEVEA